MDSLRDKTDALSSEDKNKFLRFLEYLEKILSLRSAVVRDIESYEKVLWLSSIPRQKGCYTRAWHNNEDSGSDNWLEVQLENEPEMPKIPSICKEWVDDSTLHGDHRPKLRPVISDPSKKMEDNNGIAQADYMSDSYYYLDQFPEITKAWDQYIENQWDPWKRAHDAWKAVYAVYSELFSIHQEQLRLGEEYELILGLGMLTWQTPTGQMIKRHLIVADAYLDFEAKMRKFSVYPNLEGANLRIELDMFDVENQPVEIIESARELLRGANDDPWDEKTTEDVLKSIVNSIHSGGTYLNSLNWSRSRPTPNPVVEYAPALILRKRSTKGILETLRRIKKDADKVKQLPILFASLVELDRKPAQAVDDSLCERKIDFNTEVFFPKKSNEEQRRIAYLIGSSRGVLVQGPPGTGKSHTIANLICHLLATGNRILVTAKTPRALQVLREMIPDDLRPLCVTLLGDANEERHFMEASVKGIIGKRREWNEEAAQIKISELNEKLQRLREERARIDRQICNMRESETHTYSVSDGFYQGTPARIAEAVSRDREKYRWFTDDPLRHESLPINSDEFSRLLGCLRYFSPKRRRDLGLRWPDDLPTTEEVSKYIQEEGDPVSEEQEIGEKADERIIDLLSSSGTDDITEAKHALTDLLHQMIEVTSIPYPFIHDALRDILYGSSDYWKKLSKDIKDSLARMEPLISVADSRKLTFPKYLNEHKRRLYEDACKLQEYMKRGKKLKWHLFLPKEIRDRIYVVELVRIDGRKCDNLEQISALCGVLFVKIELENIRERLSLKSSQPIKPIAQQISEAKSAVHALDKTLQLEYILKRCQRAIEKLNFGGGINLGDMSQVEKLLTALKLALTRRQRQQACEKLKGLEKRLRSIASDSQAHPVVASMLNAIHERDVEKYTVALSHIHKLTEDRNRLKLIDGHVARLSSLIPNLMDELKRNCMDPEWDERIKHFEEAWRWARAKHWVEQFVRSDDLPNLNNRAKQIEDEIGDILESLASIKAWSYCFGRLNTEHERSMEAWRQAMNRLGKGTGKHAPKYRGDAQRHLERCREAVPTWIMPLHRVWDTVSPEPEIFDMIIVDEASQCGLEALPLFFMAKKLLIVGDDKQISPEAVGVNRERAFNLINHYLHDFQYKDTFDVVCSLFDQGKLRFGKSQVTLREHFRCMPEIIRFSNELCYKDTPLIPLRQFGDDRLSPLQHVYVENGYREGEGNRVINRPEARAIVEKIVEVCENPSYKELTMGVIVLQGEAQASLIESMLLEKLPAEEIERRRLICGNPYSFQGDERNIIFLSMVAAPNERIGPFTKEEDVRRFNVAASRARDQVWLFHSVRLEELSEKDLRRRLLEHFIGHREPTHIAGQEISELERIAHEVNRSIEKPPKPFESWFEVDVALELLRKGYKVNPQFPIANKRIDLVIEGGQSRLAVECDGDYWHGSERFEEDMERQRQLERCGWEFFRVRESAFYANREEALQRLWRMLETRGIYPTTN